MLPIYVVCQDLKVGGFRLCRSDFGTQTIQKCLNFGPGNQYVTVEAISGYSLALQ
jgi:hypothetical protein